MSETPQGLTPPTVQLASLPRQWRAEAEATDPGNFDAVEAGVKHRRFAAAQTLRDCAQELDAILSISPRGCWEHPGVMGYRHPECGFCWHGKDGLDVPVAGQGANQEPRCPRCALAELENAVTWNTSCLSCARLLDSSIAEHERAERAEEKLAAIMKDLVIVLGEAEGFIGGKDNAAFTRLAEAAGVS